MGTSRWTRALQGLLALLLVSALNVSTGAETTRHPLRLEDVLATEDIGRAKFAMHDRVLLFERLPPYGEAPNIDALESDVDRSALAKIYAVDLQQPGEPHMLFEQEPDRSCWLGALSPDSTRVAMYCVRKGRLSAAVYDLAAQRLQRFNFLPNYSENLTQTPVWISNDELIYPALPEGEPQAGVFRSGMAATLNAKWSKSFAGKEPSVTVVQSTASGLENARILRPGNLIRINLRTGAETPIGDGYFYNMRVAPGGRFLAALREGGDIQPEMDGAPMGPERTYRELVVFDLQTGTMTVPCQDCHTALGTLNWSGDGTLLTFLARPAGQLLKRSSLWRYAPLGHALAKVELDGLNLACRGTRTIRTIGMGDGIAVFAAPAKTASAGPVDSSRCRSDARADWQVISPQHAPKIMTPRLQQVSGELLGATPDSLFVLAAGGVWQVGPRTAPRNITAGMKSELTPWSVGAAAAIDRSREDMFTSSRLPNRFTVLESDHEIITVDLHRGRYMQLARPSPASQLLDVTPGGDVGVFRESAADGMRLVLARPDGNRVLLSINTHLANVTPTKTATIQYKAPDGTTDLSGCLLLPPDWKPDHRYPLVVDVYPDVPSGDCDFSGLRYEPMSLRLLAAHGYVVLLPATPPALTHTADGPMRGTTPVVLAAVAAAVTAGYADPERVGLYGLSQGFTSALQMLTETHQFRAAVINFGISDFASQYGSMALRDLIGPDGIHVGDFGRFEATQFAMALGTRPSLNVQRYTSNSPAFNAEKIDTPLLIVDSDFDYFALGQSEEIFSALYRLRKEASYVTYWGEGHGLMSPANIADWWHRVDAWFDARLAPER